MHVTFNLFLLVRTKEAEFGSRNLLGTCTQEAEARESV